MWLARSAPKSVGTDLMRVDWHTVGRMTTTRRWPSSRGSPRPTTDDLLRHNQGLDPLAWGRTGGNRHDITQLIPLVERVPPARGRRGRPRQRPTRLLADRGDDCDAYRRLLRARGITPDIACRGTAHGSGLGCYRWVAERTFAWLHQFKRLLVRYDRRAEIHEALLALPIGVGIAGSE